MKDLLRPISLEQIQDQELLNSFTEQEGISTDDFDILNTKLFLEEEF